MLLVIRNKCQSNSLLFTNFVVSMLPARLTICQPMRLTRSSLYLLSLSVLLLTWLLVRLLLYRRPIVQKFQQSGHIFFGGNYNIAYFSATFQYSTMTLYIQLYIVLYHRFAFDVYNITHAFVHILLYHANVI